MAPDSDPRPRKVTGNLLLARDCCENASRLAVEIPDVITEPERQEMSALCHRMSTLYHAIDARLP